MDRAIRIWDPIVRLFHWTLVVSFATAWLAADQWDDVHEWAGYVVMGLLGVRLVWGFTGSTYARFTQFVVSPKRLTHYLSDMLRGREDRYLGHNPAGAWMILAMLLTLSLTALTGWLQTLDALWGVGWVQDTHAVLADGMVLLVFFHVAGVVVTSWRHHENLVLSMLTGNKRA